MFRFMFRSRRKWLEALYAQKPPQRNGKYDAEGRMWEYAMLVNDDFGQGTDEAIECLNVYGAQGWELVDVSLIAVHGQAIYTFKRRLR